MGIVANVTIGLVIALQSYFLILEMFLWETPKVRKAFGFTKEFAKESATLAKNQGLYNGFLAAGLVWGLLASNPEQGMSIKVFFLSCVLVAGVYGAATANKRILFVQALPALIALLLVLWTL